MEILQLKNGMVVILKLKSLRLFMNIIDRGSPRNIMYKCYQHTLIKLELYVKFHRKMW